jgi:hypothetical protein
LSFEEVPWSVVNWKEVSKNYETFAAKQQPVEWYTL